MNTKMTNCKPSPTPHCAGITLTTKDSEAQELDIASKQKRQQLFGSLHYLADCTRPDIACIAEQLERCVSQPTTTHYKAALWALRCLRGARTHGITHGPYHSPLNSYANSGHAADPDTRLFTTGSIHSFNGGPISWKSTKQRSAAPIYH